MTTILVTGVCGFIFSNFIRKATSLYPNVNWIGVDKLVKDYNTDNIFKSPNYQFHIADIADKHTMNRLFQIHQPNLVINGAAESFVDGSITDIMPFLHSNIIGVQTIINCCLEHNIPLMHISTDEVYGQQTELHGMPWFEIDPLNPRNPYSASKACSENIIIAAHNTHGLQFKMTRSCNVFGPRQKDENLIPMIIKALIHDNNITIHGDGKNYRQYIYVEDEVSALLRIMEDGKMNSTYNIGDDNFHTNLNMVSFISTLMNKKPKVEFITDRKAHDFGYNVNSDKLRRLIWSPNYNIKEAMIKTINFYKKKFEDKIPYQEA